MSPRIDAYGTIDELNSFIACLLEEIDNREDREFLFAIQSDLFSIGGHLASPAGSVCDISEEYIIKLEKEIDAMDEILPPLKAFVLPGGSKGNAQAHVCRTVCRRAERCVYLLHEAERVNENILKYLNRLSDYFFLLARKQSYINNIDEIIWQKSCK